MPAWSDAETLVILDLAYRKVNQRAGVEILRRKCGTSRSLTSLQSKLAHIRRTLPDLWDTDCGEWNRTLLGDYLDSQQWRHDYAWLRCFGEAEIEIVRRVHFMTRDDRKDGC